MVAGMNKEYLCNNDINHKEKRKTASNSSRSHRKQNETALSENKSLQRACITRGTMAQESGLAHGVGVGWNDESIRTLTPMKETL